MTDKEIIALYQKLTGIKPEVLVATFLNDKRNVKRGEEKSFSCEVEELIGMSRCKSQCIQCKTVYGK